MAVAIPVPEPDRPTEKGKNGLIKISTLGFVTGFREGIPLAVSIACYGLLVGIEARQKQFTLSSATAMSLIVFAGTAQFAALETWRGVPPLVALFVETLVINSRHLLMGLSLEPWYIGARRSIRYVSAFFMIDESWALTLKKFETAQADAGFLIGSGVVMYIAWAISTFFGFIVSSLLQGLTDPKRLAMDVVLPCVLVILVLPRWQGKRSLAPWITAAVVSAVCDRFLPPGWNVLLGGCGGALVGSLTDRGVK